MKRVVLGVCVLLGGCNATFAFQWGMPVAMYSSAATASVTVIGSDSAAGAILVSTLLADSVHYYWQLPDGTRRPYYGTPEPDPARRINVQDCTQPVDPTAGNLMCR